MVERWPPELSVIWAIAVIISQMIAQKPTIRFMQGHKLRLLEFIDAIGEVAVALSRGAHNMVTVVAAAAMMAFASGTQRYFQVRNRWAVSAVRLNNPAQTAGGV